MSLSLRVLPGHPWGAVADDRQAAHAAAIRAIALLVHVLRCVMIDLPSRNDEGVPRLLQNQIALPADPESISRFCVVEAGVPFTRLTSGLALPAGGVLAVGCRFLHVVRRQAMAAVVARLTEVVHRDLPSVGCAPIVSAHMGIVNRGGI